MSQHTIASGFAHQEMGIVRSYLLSQFQADSERAVIKSLLRLDERDLLLRLQTAHISSVMLGRTGFVFRSLSSLSMELVRRLLRDKTSSEFNNVVLPAVREAICEEWRYCEKVKLYKEEFQDTTRLAAIIADVIGDIRFDWPVPPLTTAVILVRRGLEEFCGCE